MQICEKARSVDLGVKHLIAVLAYRKLESCRNRIPQLRISKNEEKHAHYVVTN